MMAILVVWTVGDIVGASFAALLVASSAVWFAVELVLDGRRERRAKKG